MNKLKEYREALEKIKNSPQDRILIAGKGIGVAAGVAGGVAASSTVAATAGATTLLGSSTLGTWLGGIFVTATPIGWVVGTAIAGGAVAYGIAKFIENGAKNDEKKLQNIKELEKIIKKLEKESNQSNNLDEKYQKIAKMYISLIDYGMVTEEEVAEVLKMIKNNELDINLAFEVALENLSAAQNVLKK